MKSIHIFVLTPPLVFLNIGFSGVSENDRSAIQTNAKRVEGIL